MQRIFIPPKSLYESCTENESSCLAEIIRERREENPAGKMDQERLRYVVGQLLDSLDTRERQVIGLRFGLADGVPWTLQQIGDLLKASRQRIGQIEKSAMRKLRQPSRAGRLAGFLDEPPARLLRAAADLQARTGNRSRRRPNTSVPVAWSLALSQLSQHPPLVNDIES